MDGPSLGRTPHARAYVPRRRGRDRPGLRTPHRRAPRRRPCPGARARRRPSHCEGADGDRQGRRDQHRRPRGQRGRAQGAQGRRQRRRRRRRRGGHARRDGALQRRHRRWRLLRLLQREDRQGPHHRRPRDRPAQDAAGRVHRPGHRQALQLHARAGHQRRLGRHARHPRHLGQGARQLGHLVARRGPRARHQGRHPRLRRRRDVPPADARQRGALRGLQGHQEALPPQGRRTQGRLDLPQPRPGRHLRRDRAARHRRVLPRPAGPPDVRRRAQAAHDQEHHAPGPAGPPHAARPARLQGPLAAGHEDRLPRSRRLRHGARRRPAAPRSARRSTSSSATTCRG